MVLPVVGHTEGSVCASERLLNGRWIVETGQPNLGPTRRQRLCSGRARVPRQHTRAELAPGIVEHRPGKAAALCPRTTDDCDGSLAGHGNSFWPLDGERRMTRRDQSC